MFLTRKNVLFILGLSEHGALPHPPGNAAMTYAVSANAVRIASYATLAAAVLHTIELRRAGVPDRVLPVAA